MIFVIYAIILNLMIGKNVAITIASDGTLDRMFNGIKARDGQFPYMVLILTGVTQPDYRFMAICSGSLIGFNTILAAAHCFRGKTPSGVVVMVGLADARLYALHRYTYPLSVKFNSRNVQEATPERIHVHNDFYRDLAVVKITKPFLKTEHVNTIQYSPDEYPLGMPCNLSGYGVNEDGHPGRLSYFTTTEVQKDIRKCGFSADHPFYYCLQRPNSRDPKTCGGDSGAPLVCNNKVYGVHSTFSYRLRNHNCGAPGSIKFVSLVSSGIDDRFLSRELSSSSSQLLPQFYVFLTVLFSIGCKL